jgi:hypothetical protein
VSARAGELPRSYNGQWRPALEIAAFDERQLRADIDQRFQRHFLPVHRRPNDDLDRGALSDQRYRRAGAAINCRQESTGMKMTGCVGVEADRAADTLNEVWPFLGFGKRGFSGRIKVWIYSDKFSPKKQCKRIQMFALQLRSKLFKRLDVRGQDVLVLYNRRASALGRLHLIQYSSNAKQTARH